MSCKHCHENVSEEEHSKVEIIFTIIGVIFSILAFLLGKKSEILELILYIIGYICIGYEICLNALKKLFKKDMFDENFLMFIATIGAFILGEYVEAILVILLYKIGEFLQDKAVENSKKKISDVLDIRAKYANLLVDKEIKKVDPSTLKIGDIIVVKNGERIPVDGIVISGQTSIDMMALTGESKPVTIKENDNILSGSINISNVINIKVTSEFKDSTVSKIIDLIENASDKKSNTENIITRFSKIYTPIVTIIALVIAILPFFFNISFSEALNRAFTFLVISCPCALVISVPLSFFVGIGRCSKSGILVKGSNYLDALNDVDKIVFDKTGTLTKGVFTVTKIVSLKEDVEDNDIIEYIAECEKYSNHYIAKSIINYYNKETKVKAVKHEEIAGYGIKAEVSKKQVLVGNLELLKKEEVDISKIKTENEIGTIVYLAVDKECLGYIILSDKLKNGAKELIGNLKKCGIKEAIMLTGDIEEIANNISKEVKIDKVYSSLLPIDKVNKLQEIKESIKNNKKVAYVGDGINDSPVLAVADVSISMGKGADIAIETSDIVLMSEQLDKIVESIKIAKKTRRIVTENISFAIIVKVIFLILSSIGKMTMFFAIFADVGVALLTILNAMRIFRIDKR